MKSCIAVLLILLGSLAFGQVPTTTGTWTLYPPQTQIAVNQVTVQQPINPDGTSVWSATKGVVPVQFSLSTGFTYGPVIFASMSSGSPVFSALSFTPSPAITFDQLTSLTSVYTFATGDCHGGSLRWSVETALGNLFIYYGLRRALLTVLP